VIYDLESIWKEAVVIHLKFLSQHFSRESDENDTVIRTDGLREEIQNRKS
jgi:hypothetical protein